MKIQCICAPQDIDARSTKSKSLYDRTNYKFISFRCPLRDHKKMKNTLYLGKNEHKRTKDNQ